MYSCDTYVIRIVFKCKQGTHIEGKGYISIERTEQKKKISIHNKVLAW